jgi:hypothetical protein
MPLLSACDGSKCGQTVRLSIDVTWRTMSGGGCFAALMSWSDSSVVMARDF